ncbi:MAG: hypothetical protein GXY58_12135 [Planctomycetaceae bacterium]|nr:hypothetical protein [Planctomycetaceae bacterium]
MNVQKGDRVLVNVAPFIASARRQRDSVPCEILEVDGTRVRVATQAPCREMDVWVQNCWIDRVLTAHNNFGGINPA